MTQQKKKEPEVKKVELEKDSLSIDDLKEKRQLYIHKYEEVARLLTKLEGIIEYLNGQINDLEKDEESEEKPDTDSK